MSFRCTLSELAGRAGIPASRVEYYKRMGLLPRSHGLGRGANYGEEHWEALRKIGEYRGMGYSLAAIRAILEGRVDEVPTERELGEAGVEGGIDEEKLMLGESRSPQFVDPNKVRTSLAGVWGRVKLFEGLELHYELGKYEVGGQAVEELREAMRAILCAE